MSSTKPEVRDVLHCRRKMTDLRPQVTCAENLVKLGRMVSGIRERTAKQTYIQTRW